MAKVKTASAGATKKAASWKSNKTNTPTKVVRGGKVTKPPRRPNIKGESTNSEYSDYLCKYYEVQTQTRLCFVKIKRDTNLFNACINNSSITNAIDSGRSGPSDYNKETSIPETGIHTTDKNAENEINNYQQNLKNIANGENISTTPIDVFENTEESVTAASRNAYCAKQSFHNRHKAQNTSSVEEHREITITDNKTPTAIKKCLVKLYKNPMVSKSTPPAAEEELFALAEKEDELLALSLSQIENPVVDQEKRKAFLKLSLSKVKSRSEDKNSNLKNDSNNNDKTINNAGVVGQSSKGTQKTKEKLKSNKSTDIHNTSENLNSAVSSINVELTKSKENLALISLNNLENTTTRELSKVILLPVTTKSKDLKADGEKSGNANIPSKSIKPPVESKDVGKHTRRKASFKQKSTETNSSNDQNVDGISRNEKHVQSQNLLRKTRNKAAAVHDDVGELPKRNNNIHLEIDISENEECKSKTTQINKSTGELGNKTKKKNLDSNKIEEPNVDNITKNFENTSKTWELAEMSKNTGSQHVGTTKNTSNREFHPNKSKDENVDNISKTRRLTDSSKNISSSIIISETKNTRSRAKVPSMDSKDTSQSTNVQNATKTTASTKVSRNKVPAKLKNKNFDTNKIKAPNVGNITKNFENISKPGDLSGMNKNTASRSVGTTKNSSNRELDTNKSKQDSFNNISKTRELTDTSKTLSPSGLSGMNKNTASRSVGTTKNSSNRELDTNKSKQDSFNNISKTRELTDTSKTISPSSISATKNTRSRGKLLSKDCKYNSQSTNLQNATKTTMSSYVSRNNVSANLKNPPEKNNKNNTSKKDSQKTDEANIAPTPAQTPDSNKIVKNIEIKVTTTKTASKNKTIDMRKIHFVPQTNSTMHFEHFNNSKALELNDCEKEDDNNNHVSQKESGPECNGNGNHVKAKEGNSENNTNNNRNNPLNNDEICTTANSFTQNKSHKFFHRNDDQAHRIRQLISGSYKSTLSKKNRFIAKRSSQVRREQVYDFLSQSQSQTSDSDGNSGKVGSNPQDPMADVIKKLIEQGKVVVATNQKGRGRPRLKKSSKPTKRANLVTKQAPKAKRAYNKKGEKQKAIGKKINGAIQPTIAEEEQSNECHQENVDNFDHFMDGEDNADIDVDYNMNQPSSKPIEFPIKKATESEGTFSHLAKSVLINQAGRKDVQRLKAQRLLAMAKKIISTPKNNKITSTQPPLEADFSPIHPLPTKRPATKPSPWRVEEDANLPRVFNFSRSSSNLPSFSSDFIPVTPRKETPKNKTLQQIDEILPNMTDKDPQLPAEVNSPMTSMIPSMAALSANQVSTPLVNNQNFSVPSSFSSNDSNAENQPPPRLGPDKSPNENSNIFDLKQLPNPRRALTYRSPLKAINILEVVHLPPLSHLKDVNNQNEKAQAELNDITFKSPQKPKTTPSKRKSKKSKNSPERDLFGFEEFLTQTDVSSQESQPEQSLEGSVCNKIHDKLQGLRRLRPASTQLENSLLQQNICNPVGGLPNLFNDAGRMAKPQKTIKQMLCSTMVEQPSTSKKALEELNLRNLQKQTAGFNCATNVNSNISELFKDPDPETTFNEEDPHRTYINPFKRKRRLRENKLVFIYDSDESWDEETSSPKKKKRGRQKHQNSHETDTSSEQKVPKRKRQCKEQPELKNFVEEFTEMCKEVESYEIIVEKSA